MYEGTSDTKAAAVFRLALVQGGILAWTLLGLFGAVRKRPTFSIWAAALLFLEAIPLIFSFSWLMIFASGLFLLVARLAAPLPRIARVSLRAIGSMAGIWLLLYAYAMLVHRTAPLFLQFSLIALAFVTTVAWWPQRATRPLVAE